MFEASSLTATSIEKSPYTSNAEDSAFNHQFGTSPYKLYAENPKHGAQFASVMAFLVQNLSFILQNPFQCLCILRHTAVLWIVEQTYLSPNLTDPF